MVAIAKIRLFSRSYLSKLISHSLPQNVATGRFTHMSQVVTSHSLTAGRTQRSAERDKCRSCVRSKWGSAGEHWDGLKRSCLACCLSLGKDWNYIALKAGYFQLWLKATEGTHLTPVAPLKQDSPVSSLCPQSWVRMLCATSPGEFASVSAWKVSERRVVSVSFTRRHWTKIPPRFNLAVTQRFVSFGVLI